MTSPPRAPSKPSFRLAPRVLLAWRSMLGRFGRRQAVPIDEDGSRDYLARTLPVILWLMLLGCVASVVVALANAQNQTAAGILSSTALTGGSLALVRRGRLRLASGVFLANGLLLAAYLLAVGSGLRDLALLVYPLILVMGGMLLEGAAFGALLGLCLASLLLGTYGHARRHGGLVPGVHAAELLYVTIVLAVTAAAVWLLSSALRRSLREARTSERALRASEASFTIAFRSSPVMMAITSIDDARFLDVNDAFSAATGVVREEVVGSLVIDLVAFVDKGEPEHIREGMLARGAVRGEPLRLRTGSGDVLWTLVSGEAIELDGRRCGLYAITDVTDRKRAEDALAASEERYRLISEVSSDYTFSNRLGDDGRFHLEWVAGAFERITGYSFEEYGARGGWRAALHPDDVEQDARDMQELQANRPVVTEVRTIACSGEARWVRVYAHPVWSEPDHRLVGIYGAVQDVTERRRVAADREALLRELEAKNAELERFSYTVSHDLKSPLITVQSFIGFLEQDALAGNVERLRSDVARITAATAKMQRMLNELLELSRVGRVASAPAEVRLGDLALEAVAQVRGRLDRAGARVEIARDLPAVWGDRSRLLVVLQNLLDNAVKFMGKQKQPRIEVGSRRGEDGATILYVRDNGAGIDPRHHDRVFELFEKLDPGSEGTGLGLALVKRIIETHQGRVWVESQGEGRGTTFCFTLGDTRKATGAVIGA